MPDDPLTPASPPQEGATDIEIAEFIIARCRELERLSLNVPNGEVSSLLRQVIEETQRTIKEGERRDA